MHDLSLGIQRTFFYIMYIKSRYSFALFSLVSLASRSREKRKTGHVKFVGVQWKAGVESMLRKKEYARSERSFLHLPRMNSPPHLLYCIYLPYFGSSTNTSSFITSSEISNLLLKKKNSPNQRKKPPRRCFYGTHSQASTSLYDPGPTNLFLKGYLQ